MSSPASSLSLKGRMKPSWIFNMEKRFCPKCGSENIGVDATLGGVSDYCKDCGYNNRTSGVVTVGNFPEKEKITKQKKTKN